MRNIRAIGVPRWEEIYISLEVKSLGNSSTTGRRIQVSVSGTKCPLADTFVRVRDLAPGLVHDRFSMSGIFRVFVVV